MQLETFDFPGSEDIDSNLELAADPDPWGGELGCPLTSSVPEDTKRELAKLVLPDKHNLLLLDRSS